MKKGLTILEVLLSVAILSLLAFLSIPLYQSFQNRNDLDIAAVTFVHTARRAQILSQGMDADTTWGVSIQTGSIILFQGASYSARDTAFDETFEIPSNISLAGTQEFVFAKFTGLPQTTGTLTLTSPNNDTKTITINAKGTITY